MRLHNQNNMANQPKQISQFLASEVFKRLEVQLKSIEGMDTKAGITSTLVVAIIVGLLAMNWFVSLSKAVIFLVLLLLLAAVFCSLRALFVRDWHQSPNAAVLFHKYMEETDEVIRYNLAALWADDFSHNTPKLKTKQKWVNASFLFLAGAILLLCAIVVAAGSTIIIPPLKEGK